MTTLARIAVTIAIALPTAALAAPRSVTQTAQYTLADNDSRTVARQICASTAKRTALDKSGSLFESGLTASRSETKGKIADDAHLEMRSYVAAVVASETIAEHFSVKNDRVTLSCTVRLTYDPDEMGARLKKTAGTTEVNQHLAAQQAQIDILENQLKTLRSTVETPAPEPAAAPAPEAMYPPPVDAAAAQPPLPQIAEAPQAAPPPAVPVPARKPRQLAQNNAAPIPLYPPQPSDAQQYDQPQQYDPPPTASPRQYDPTEYAPARQYPPVAAPPPVAWPAQAPVAYPAYPVATAYAQPAPAYSYYYYYPPAPVYAPRLAYYAPRVVYRGWYYGGRRGW